MLEIVQLRLKVEIPPARQRLGESLSAEQRQRVAAEFETTSGKLNDLFNQGFELKAQAEVSDQTGSHLLLILHKPD